MVGLLTACSPGDLVGNAPVPSDVSDPAVTRTPAGAVAAYSSTLTQFRVALGGGEGNSGNYVAVSALLGDELQSGEAIGAPAGSLPAVSSPLDRRELPEQTGAVAGDEVASSAVYSSLQKVRGQGREALGLLRDYGPANSSALRGRVYAALGYSEVLLAELFCSGIPLSTLDYGGDYTLKPGSSTEDVLRHAVALFDTALVLSTDSAQFLHVARVGRARALLGLGEFESAASAVVDVPDGFREAVSYSAASGANATNFARIQPGLSWPLTVADREGVNGLDYRTSGDPRTSASDVGQNFYGAALYHPDKYAPDGTSPILLADWVEARLIEAEAALQAGDASTWLARLNHLRGTAISPALPDTTDPGTPEGRVDLLFRERAFWLFLTGHRQGDLRRLVRQYKRSPELVYPSGGYPGGAAGNTVPYGTDVTVPIPARERVSNSLFTGCLSRGA
jgi:hypothetical protein